MPRKKKSESIDEIVKAAPEVLEQQPVQEKVVEPDTQVSEQQEESSPVEETKDITETVESQPEDAAVQEPDLDTNNSIDTQVSETVQDSDDNEDTTTTADSDGEEVSHNYGIEEIPQELLEEQEKIQKEGDKIIQDQKERNQKPDLDRDTVSFEDFQKEIQKGAEEVNRPFLIPLLKGSVKTKYSVGLKTRSGVRIIAHKLSKEKAERYIENFTRLNK